MKRICGGIGMGMPIRICGGAGMPMFTVTSAIVGRGNTDIDANINVPKISFFIVLPLLPFIPDPVYRDEVYIPYF
jgi:hypothetical protein